MASIYFYYNELLRQSADQAVSSGTNTHFADLYKTAIPDEDAQQQQQRQQEADSAEKKQRGGHPSDPEAKQGNQDEDAALKAVGLSTEATMAALQPRMNRLAYLHTTGNVNLEALARSLGPKL